MKQTTAPLNPNELLWIQTQLENAQTFVRTWAPDASSALSLAALDRAWAAWLASEPAGGDAINPVINCVGVAFGQALVDGIGLQWVIATDEHGSELAVYGLPNRGDVLVYPANFVVKRWERRETNFLEDAYRRIADDVSAVARDWGASG